MRRTALFAVIFTVATILAGCAANQVDDSILPTLVPTIDAQELIRAAIATRPTSFPTPTDTPLPPSPVTVSDADMSPTDTHEPVAIEYGDQDAAQASDEPVELETAEPEDIPDTGEITEHEEASTQPESEVGEPAEGTDDSVEEDSDSSTEDSAVDDVDELEPVESGAANEVETEASDLPIDDAQGSDEVSTEATESEPAYTAEETGDPLLAGMPDSLIALISDADPDNGSALTLSNSCTGCHNLDPNAMMAGPTWYDLANTAATRIEGESAGLYLYNSIVDPNAYVVEGYIPNLMTPNFIDTISEEDMADILAYLLSIRGS